MSAKEKLITLAAVIGIVALMVTIVDSVEGRLVIEDLAIEDRYPREGCLTWKNQGTENSTTNLTNNVDVV